MTRSPLVEPFYDPATFTFTYVVYDRIGGRAAIIDPVLDYDPAAARTSTASADHVLRFVNDQQLTVDWILETHAHADHLTAAAHLKQHTGLFLEGDGAIRTRRTRVHCLHPPGRPALSGHDEREARPRAESD